MVRGIYRVLIAKHLALHLGLPHKGEAPTLRGRVEITGNFHWQLSHGLSPDWSRLQTRGSSLSKSSTICFATGSACGCKFVSSDSLLFIVSVCVVKGVGGVVRSQVLLHPD